MAEQRVQLRGAVVVELKPLGDAQIVEHIENTVENIDSWDGVLTALRVGRPGAVLAEQFRLPWRLTMAITVNTEHSGETSGLLQDPGRLLALPPAQLRDSLLPLYAEALLMRARRIGGAWSKSLQSDRALTTLAAYLTHNAQQRRALGGRTLPSVDMVVHQLWPIAGRDWPRRVTAALSILLWLPAVAAATWYLTFAQWSVALKIAVGLVLSGLPMVAASMSLAWWPHPRRFVLRRLTVRHGWYRLGLAGVGSILITGALSALHDRPFAIGCGVVFWFVFGLGSTLAVRDSANILVLAQVGTACGAVISVFGRILVGFLGADGGIVTGAVAAGVALLAGYKAVLRVPGANPGYATNPVFESFVRNDFLAGCTAGAITAALTATFLALSVQRPSSIAIFLASLGAGVSIGFGLVAETWRRHVAMLICCRRLPLHLGGALEVYCRAGLLRHAGIAYQFRHLELLEHFAGRTFNAPE